MPVQIEERDLKNASPDVKARNARIYSSLDTQPSRPVAAKPGRKPPQKPPAKTRREPPARKPKPPPPSRRERVQRAATVRVQRGVSSVGNRTSATVGGFFVVLTGAGIAFAIIRNPAIVTVPLQFVTTIIQRMTAVFSTLGKMGNISVPMAGVRPIPQPSTGSNP